jgi:thiamine-phosphate pyrophosphorylase
VAPARRNLPPIRFCVLISKGFSDRPLVELSAAAAAGGADCIQLRLKDVSDREFLEAARACKKAAGDALFIVNDRPDIALLSGADGVHLGQDDVPVDDTRRLVGEERIIGVSASSPLQVIAAGRSSADYLGVGCVFPTDTKDAVAQGLDWVREAVDLAIRPVLAIGGIKRDNARAVIEAGADGVAVCGAVIGAPDPSEAARAIRAEVDAAVAARETP